MGAKLYATVGFTMKEEYDGYQYIQILADKNDGNSSYDGNDPGGGVNDPSKSLYKACFELSYGSGSYPGTVSDDYNQYFPHRYDYKNRSAGSQSATYTEFAYADAYLYQQKFQSGYRAQNTGALVLDPDVTYVHVRFDAAGEDNDTWYFKNMFVRCALQESVAPSAPAQADYVISPGPYTKGSQFTISVVFSEIVQATLGSNSRLHTTWGNLTPVSGYEGSNVITFSGPIGGSGQLMILGFSNVTVKDLCGNTCPIPAYTSGGSPFFTYSTSEYSISASHNYSISYDLDGGTETSNPTSYNYESGDITLNIPARTGYTFEGWTGTGLNSASKSVTIPSGSHGDRAYKATWSRTPYTITWKDGNGDTLKTQTYYYGDTPSYSGATPVYTDRTSVG